MLAPGSTRLLVPVGLEERADPFKTPPHVTPEWYFLAVYQGLKFRVLRAEYCRAMSLTELKQTVLELPPTERHEFVAWVNRLEADYGDVPGEALDQLAAEIWDQDDWHAPAARPMH